MYRFLNKFEYYLPDTHTANIITMEPQGGKYTQAYYEQCNEQHLEDSSPALEPYNFIDLLIVAMLDYYVCDAVPAHVSQDGSFLIGRRVSRDFAMVIDTHLRTVLSRSESTIASSFRVAATSMEDKAVELPPSGIEEVVSSSLTDSSDSSMGDGGKAGVDVARDSFVVRGGYVIVESLLSVEPWSAVA